MIRNDNEPLILQRADPQIVLAENGLYYFIATVPEFDRIELRCAESIERLADATPEIIWRKHDEGPTSKYIWAPELHRVFGKWVIYFAATGSEPDENGVFDHRIYALINEAEDPMQGEFTGLTQIRTGMESFSLDSTVLSVNGKYYFVWAQRDYAIPGNSNLYIAEMSSPTELSTEPVLLSRPEFDWECQGFLVNEGPAVLEHDNKLFLTYSGSATDERYAVGMLTADIDSDILNPASWQKSETPVMVTDEIHRIFGPGHNNFFRDSDGTDYIVFHARPYPGFIGDPLSDPNRNTYVRRIEFDDNGNPVFQ